MKWLDIKLFFGMVIGTVFVICLLRLLGYKTRLRKYATNYREVKTEDLEVEV